MFNKFIKSSGNDIVFIGHYLEIYIPDRFFETGIARIDGGIIRTFGLLNCAVYDQKNNIISKDIINLPTQIKLYLKDIESKRLTISDEIGEEVYRVVKYFKDDSVMQNALQADIGNVEQFVGMLSDGKLNYIPYNKILEVWEKNMMLNKMSLGVPSSILEMMIMEIYRDKKNPTYRFSNTLNKDPKTSQYAYHAANIREMCSRNSTFAALTFEDMDAMITASLNMNRYNKKQVESPIEKIIKM